MQGWIKLHRQITESPVFSDPDILRLWILCLSKAAHKETKVMMEKREIELGPGEFITGRFSLSEEYNKLLPPRKKIPDITLWRWMKTLEKCGNLNIKSTNKYSVVSICKWHEYQEDEQQMNNKRTTDEQQMNTNKNVKNDENDKNEINKDIVPYTAIINYLNQKSNSAYKATSKATQRHIKARWNEGYRMNEFQSVIDKKSAEWLLDPKMSQYLRPETLFGTKFENYLNQPVVLKGGQPNAKHGTGHDGRSDAELNALSL